MLDVSMEDSQATTLLSSRAKATSILVPRFKQSKRKNFMDRATLALH